MNDIKEICGKITTLLAELDAKSGVGKILSAQPMMSHDSIFRMSEEEQKIYLDAYLEQAKELDRKLAESDNDFKYRMTVVSTIIANIYGVNSPAYRYVTKLSPIAQMRNNEKKAIAKIQKYQEFKEFEQKRLEIAERKKKEQTERLILKNRLIKVGVVARLSKALEEQYALIAYDAKVIAYHIGLNTEDDDEIFIELSRRGYKYENGEFIKD